MALPDPHAAEYIALVAKIDKIEQIINVKLDSLTDRTDSLQSLVVENLTGVRAAQNDQAREVSAIDRRVRDLEETTRNLPVRIEGLDHRIDENANTIRAWKAQIAILAAMFTAAGAAGAAGLLQVLGGG